MFHLTIDHDSESYLEMAHMMQLLSTNELNTTTSFSELAFYSNGDFGNLFWSMS